MFSYPVLEKVELYCLEPEQDAVIEILFTNTRRTANHIVLP